VQIVPPNEVVVVVGFELKMGQPGRHDEPVHPVQRDRAGDGGTQRAELVARAAVLQVEGQRKFLGRLGQFRGQRALQVVRPVEPADRF
jgi:flagellar motor switch protein FliM